MSTPDPNPRQLLGEFLRTRRARLSPEAVGLPSAPRRRTPGLRREEVAQLSGVSATWYTWLEQGREAQASPQALARIAQALHLGRAERAYLFELAGRRDPAAPAAAPVDRPSAAMAAIVNAFPGPAYALDAGWNAVAWNPAAERLFPGWLDGAERNLLRFVFCASQARSLIVDWEDRARRVLAEFRADFGRSREDREMRRLADALSAEEPLFARWWTEQGVLDREGGLRRFQHPTEGLLSFEQATFHPAERPDWKLVVLLPQGPCGASQAQSDASERP
jgi:transcriptional regulator with XRE-family HTH domain